MTEGWSVTNTLILLTRRALSYVSPERIAVLFSLLDMLRALSPWADQGMYEILDYDSTLDLKDIKGKTAVFKRHQRVKFLQDHIIAFQDHAWGDGKIFAKYKISKGRAVDRYKEGDRWNVLISLRETQSKGDIEDFYIERTVRDSFTGDEEWRQVEIRHPTRRLRIRVIFPEERRCRRAVVHQRSRNQTTRLGERHFADLPDGRQMLTWETKNITPLEIFSIRWRW
jgi:hypothetical protein